MSRRPDAPYRVGQLVWACYAPHGVNPIIRALVPVTRVMTYGSVHHPRTAWKATITDPPHRFGDVDYPVDHDGAGADEYGVLSRSAAPGSSPPPPRFWKGPLPDELHP
ncbi:hypothetical protein Ppa06_57390 [Planomonospora parontospora subsp. parontospora]|uniref:Uncharacterized protein n=1 Tax=Planomonospora parontospora subsp. parontospora TaxID=97194 RepID=A0ABQ4HIK6_9ACTN|nr:hypothetical protein [Planomonospora parontospora]GII11941.1 hypothetical protein Ppa06_57390 [Planomonospora parontospora subsp. parontospora]